MLDVTLIKQIVKRSIRLFQSFTPQNVSWASISRFISALDFFDGYFFNKNGMKLIKMIVKLSIYLFMKLFLPV